MGVEPAIAAAAVPATLLAAVVAGAAVRRWLVFPAKIDSTSMAPALAPGRKVLARRLADPGRIRRGDVVVVYSRELGHTIVKRVLGLSGDQVVVGPGGGVRINDGFLPEPYVVFTGGPGGAFQVPPGHLLLLGDNRASSCDARHWQAPYVPFSDVRGRVVPGRGRGYSLPVASR